MLTWVNEELVKQEAYAPSFWNRATVKGPRTSVSTFSHGPEPGLDAPGPDGIVVSWLWQLAAAEVEGELVAAVGRHSSRHRLAPPPEHHREHGPGSAGAGQNPGTDRHRPAEPPLRGR